MLWVTRSYIVKARIQRGKYIGIYHDMQFGEF